MNQIAVAPEAVGPSSGSWRRVAGVAILAAAAVALGLLTVASIRSAPPPGSSVPVNAVVEARWGIRVSQVAMTADGGMVDFRFLVLDADKAWEMMQSPENLPVLRVEATGTMIVSTSSMAARHDLTPGRTYFLLYRNTAGAVRPGSIVTVIFGDQRIEHVVAR